MTTSPSLLHDPIHMLLFLWRRRARRKNDVALASFRIFFFSTAEIVKRTTDLLCIQICLIPSHQYHGPGVHLPRSLLFSQIFFVETADAVRDALLTITREGAGAFRPALPQVLKTNDDRGNVEDNEKSRC